MASFRSRMKRLKLKKLQPGILAQKLAHAGAILGVPGAATADATLTRIGRRVDQAKRVYNRAKAEIDREAKNRGISQWEAADRLAGKALAGADAALGIEDSTKTVFVIAGIVVVLFLFMRGRK